MEKVKLDQSTIDNLRNRGRSSLFFFARAILGFSDFDKNIHKPICDELQKDENKRVMIVLPRDWFKSSMGSVAYPIWLAVNNPNIRILIVQNSMSNARKKLSSIKQMIENNKLLRVLYPKLLPRTRNTWTAECLTVNRDGSFPEGTFEAAGTGTAVTYRHYDVVIEDDTVSPQIDDMTGIIQQPTQLEIEKAIGFHRLIHPLLLHPQESKIVIIGTRWCENDLLGWIMNNTTNYKILQRSARENGNIIWSRYNDDVLRELEENVGPYMFSTLFMNQPLNDLSAVFKRDWYHYYQTIPHNNIVYCTSVDPASAKQEGTSNPDYTVVLTTCIDRTSGQIYIIHYTRERMNPGEQVDAIFDHYRAYKPLVVKIEAIAYQRTLVYWVKKRQDYLNMPFYVEPIKGMAGSKVDRIKGLQPYFAAGKISMRADMGELERELLSFPHGTHDDIIDALSMQRDFWYKIGEDEKVHREIQNRDNDFSGQSILDELMGRANMANRYPFDMGLNYEKVKQNQLREYSYRN